MIDQFIIEAIQFKGKDISLSELNTLKKIQEDIDTKEPDFRFDEQNRYE